MADTNVQIEKPAISAVMVPALAIDEVIYKGRTLPPRQTIERRVIANLIAHMAQRGFPITGVHDYEEFTRATDTKSVMELVFNLDGCNLHFVDKDGEAHCCVIVLGNDGWDCISDWFISSAEFDQAMQDFDAEVFV